MSDRLSETPGDGDDPIPRDLPDQQATDDDPWTLRQRPPRSGHAVAEEDEGPEDVPDTDEAGTERRGEPRPRTAGPGHPAPEESSG